MNLFILVAIGVFVLAISAILGYFARQSIARKQSDEIETTLQKRISQAKKTADEIISRAKEKSDKVIDETKKDITIQRREIFNAEKTLLRRENILGKKVADLEKKEDDFRQKVEQIKKIEADVGSLREAALKKLEKIANLPREKAKKELLENLEREYNKDILERMEKLEAIGEEKYEKKAKELLALAIQKYALPQAQEITTSTVNLPSDDIKGRIIGKEGRNIKSLERLTGVEIIVDETPETVVVSGFDPIRRQIAKTALEKLIQDGRIQPAKIEETVKKAETEIISQIKEAGERAVYEAGVINLDPRVVQILGRLRFRTSYGQNVLLHSIEVSYLASSLASELGANVRVCQEAGLLHDIGKAVDHQIQGSHVDIGIKILEKFGVKEEVINAMKSHHDEYPAESIEAIIIKVADQISGARPGARRDTLENYLKRLEELESIATSFPGVNKAYAIQAGREIRVFVSPEKIDDLSAKKLAREIAKKIQEELRYPGEIKVTLIRENRIVEYAR